MIQTLRAGLAAALVLLGSLIAAAAAMADVVTGAERLAVTDFAALKGKRVGLITNQTSTVGREHLADLMRRSTGVTLAAIFAPEHGFRGTEEAGKKVAGGRDERTGVQVFSLYGATRKPTREMLRGLDVLVFDIQDIGVRYYTYISTMALAMQAAAEAGLEFVVLDRPNPLGGDTVSGFMLEPAQRSFVGQVAIPMVHGLTVGELADLIKGERLMPGLEKLKLDVVSMSGWQRSMRWPATGRAMPRTSPNIGSFETALVYAGTGLLEGTSASEGRGTDAPFMLVGAPWVDKTRLAASLNGAGLAGVHFEPATFTPRSIPGVADKPKHEGSAVNGVRIRVMDARAYQPVETGVHVLSALAAEASRAGQRFFTEADFLAKLAGTRRLQAMIEAHATPSSIIAAYAKDVEAFKVVRAKYLKY